MDTRPTWPLTHPTDGIGDAEWRARCDLAAGYHLLRHYRMTDITNQYAALRVPGEEAFLTQRYGWLNEEVTASNLIKVSLEGETLEPQKGEPNPAAVEIARAFFRACPEHDCLMHVHTRNIMGVSALDCGLLPVSQAYLMVGGAPEIGYSRYAFDCTDDFVAALARALADRAILIEAFHGAFVRGRTMAEAFFRTFYLDQACNVQLAIQSTGQSHGRFEEAEQARLLEEMHVSGWYRYDGSFEWPALLRLCDKYAAQYAT